jgi:hypothetical protein
MPAGAKNNLNAYLAIYSKVCVLWAAVRLTQQRTLMDGDKTVAGSCLHSYEWYRQMKNTGVTLLKWNSKESAYCLWQCFSYRPTFLVTMFWTSAYIPCDNVLNISLHSLWQCFEHQPTFLMTMFWTSAYIRCDNVLNISLHSLWQCFEHQPIFLVTMFLISTCITGTQFCTN